MVQNMPTPLELVQLRTLPASSPASASRVDSGTSSDCVSVGIGTPRRAATYIDPSQIHAHILGKLSFRLCSWLGILLELAFKDVHFILPQARLRLIALNVRHCNHRG